jgi:allantoinase
MTGTYPRDMVGYGARPPHPHWPDGARLALQIVVNYEEGGENAILHGDAASEAFLSEIVGAVPLLGQRHMSMESIYEYGSRAGFWRLMRLFETRRVPVTIFAVGMALERHPEAARAMVELGHEVASHGWRWIDYRAVDEATEREHLKRAIAAIEATTGQRPLGWYTGRTSENTRRLVVEEAVSSTTPIPMPTTCPIGSRSAGAIISSCPIRSTPTTCGSPPPKGSIPAISSLLICATRSTCSMPKGRTCRR